MDVSMLLFFSVNPNLLLRKKASSETIIIKKVIPRILLNGFKLNWNCIKS
jgi:hypothetical protein